MNKYAFSFHVPRSIKLSSLIFMLSVLSACGSSDSDTKTGVFVDSAVEGVTYTSGEITGITDSEGRFEYKSGQTVTFTIGDIVLGTVEGADVITPIDLVPDANDASNPTVLNIASFLQTLDDDGNPDNGIKILQMVREAAEGASIDFTVSGGDFFSSSEVNALIKTLTNLTNAGERDLVSALLAAQHLQNTLLNYFSEQEPGDNNNGNGGNSASIAISGTDTSIFGTELMVNDFVYFAKDEFSEGQPALFMMVSEGFEINNKLPMPTSSIDPNNIFIINAFEYGISMSITKDGIKYDYVCTTLSADEPCGSGFNFNTNNRSLTLTNVSVHGNDTLNVLTLNGTITAD